MDAKRPMNALPRFDGHLTVDEYLAIERSSETRHEYVNGELHALAGASERHQLIVLNIASFLLSRLRGSDCRVLIDGLKLQVSETLIYYPDVMINCNPADDDPYVKRAATIVFEVLSPTTASTDRREKAMFYTRLPDLLAYVIVAQDDQLVELHWRPDPDSNWRYQLVFGHPLTLPGINVELPLAAIYEGIDTDTAESAG